MSSVGSPPSTPSSSQQRRCPGTETRPCGLFMAEIARDPHPFCSRCRGRPCSQLENCEVCDKWSPEQWAAYEQRRKRPPSSEKQSSRLGELETGFVKLQTDISSRQNFTDQKLDTLQATFDKLLGSITAITNPGGATIVPSQQTAIVSSARAFRESTPLLDERKPAPTQGEIFIIEDIPGTSQQQNNVSTYLLQTENKELAGDPPLYVGHDTPAEVSGPPPRSRGEAMFPEIFH